MNFLLVAQVEQLRVYGYLKSELYIWHSQKFRPPPHHCWTRRNFLSKLARMNREIQSRRNRKKNNKDTLCSCDTVTDKNRRGDGEEVGTRRNSARASKENKTRIFLHFFSFLCFFARHPIQSTFVLTVTRSSMKSKKIGYKKNHSKANGGWLCSLVRVVVFAVLWLICFECSVRFALRSFFDSLAVFFSKLLNAPAREK